MPYSCRLTQQLSGTTMTPSLASATPTQHTNLTTSQNDTQMNETLRLLSLQLQQLPPQQLSTLLLQAISGGTQTPVSETIVNNPALPASLIPTSGATVISSSQSTASFNLLPKSTASSQAHPYQLQLMNLLPRATPGGTQLSKSQVPQCQVTFTTQNTIGCSVSASSSHSE